MLGEIQAYFPKNEVFFWRDKQRHEIDFVIKRNRSKRPIAIECKIKASKFDVSRGLKSFRNRYPDGLNILVTLDHDEPEVLLIDGIELTVCGYSFLRDLFGTNHS